MMAEPKNRLTAEQLRNATEGRQGGHSRVICPSCDMPGFVVRNTYYTVHGVCRRLRKCRFCGFARSETAQDPIPDS